MVSIQHVFNDLQIVNGLIGQDIPDCLDTVRFLIILTLSTGNVHALDVKQLVKPIAKRANETGSMNEWQ